MPPEATMVEREIDWTILYKKDGEIKDYKILLFSSGTPHASLVTITSTCDDPIDVEIHSRMAAAPAAPDLKTTLYRGGSLALNLAMVDVYAAPKVTSTDDIAFSGTLHVAHVLNGP